MDNKKDDELELKRQKEEMDEEVNPIFKLRDEGKLSYEEYLEKLIGAFERAKEKYCKRHGITKDKDGEDIWFDLNYHD